MSSRVLKIIPRGSLLTLKGKKDLIGVEIGVQWGANARWMLDNLNIQKLYLVDPYIPYPSVSGNISENYPETEDVAYKYLFEYNNIIEWIKKTSADAAKDIPNDLDFVYIDGDHRAKMLINDIRDYINKVKLGGLFGGHDYDRSQVKRVINKIFEGSVKTGKNNDWWVIKGDFVEFTEYDKLLQIESKDG